MNKDAALRRLRMKYMSIAKRIEMRAAGMNLPHDDSRFAEITGTHVQEIMRNLGEAEPQIHRFNLISAYQHHGLPGILHALTKTAEAIEKGES